MKDAEIETLRRRAEAGDPLAQIALGRNCESSNDNQMARGWFARAAQSGSNEALRLLGANLLVHPPLAIADGVEMVRLAAERGDIEAVHLCAVLAANDFELKDRWSIALDYLVNAAERGHTLARKQLALLSGIASEDWRSMREAINISEWLAIPRAHVLSESPPIRCFDGFLPAALSNWIIARARGRTLPATVYLPQTGAGGRIENMRTNSHAGFSVADCDVILILIRARIVAASNIAPLGHEWPMALHYRIGEEYGPHFDFFDVSSAALARDVAQSGQRIATFLIYLNEDFDGGETDFPRLNIRYRGKRGDALLFFSVQNGKPDARTLHAGLPPTRGEKWLYSQWIREPRKL